MDIIVRKEFQEIVRFKMENEDIKQLNKIAESSRKNAKVLDKLINKYKEDSNVRGEGLKGGNENEKTNNIS